MSQTPLPGMVRIPAGSFLMGSEEGEADERPVHEVFIDETILAVHPVTNEEYAAFVRDTHHRPPAILELPSIVSKDSEALFRDLAAPYVWNEGRMPEGRGRHPVTMIDFGDALDYCGWLTATTGVPVRLPTEAEWEKAARGGLEGRRYPWGDEIDLSHANFLPHASLKPRRGTTPVCAYPSNGYGVFDMAGGVWEWTSDWYDAEYYARSETHNPRGPSSGVLRVLRGGAWVNDDISYLRCASRHAVPGDTYCYSIGFRIAIGPTL